MTHLLAPTRIAIAHSYARGSTSLRELAKKFGTCLQLSNDVFGRIKGQPIEDRYLPDSSNPRRTTNSRNKRCALVRPC